MMIFIYYIDKLNFGLHIMILIWAQTNHRYMSHDL